jgi:formate dehydrogenase subunit gamma
VSVSDITTIADIVAVHAGREGPLLPILHDVQAAFGHVSEVAIVEIALALNLTRAEVHGVVSFYHDFRDVPVAVLPVKLCRAEACQARGVEALYEGLSAEVKGRIEMVYCLGLCSVGPAALLPDGSVRARLDADALGALVAA